MLYFVSADHRTAVPIPPDALFPWEKPSGRPPGPQATIPADAAQLRHTIAYIPHTFDPGTLPPRHQDYACWILHLITRYQRRHRLTDEAWVPLAQTYLETMIRQPVYAPILTALIATGVVERTDSARPHTCYCYRLTTPHRAAHLVAHTITKRSLLTAVYRCQIAMEQALTLPVHQALHRWLQTVTVADGGSDVKDGGPLSRRAVVFDELRRRNVWIKVCQYGRVHTPMTVLAKEYRPYVRLDGHANLVSVDVSHCQFVLLSHWLRERGCAVDAAFTREAVAATLYSSFGRALGGDREIGKVAVMKLLYGLPRKYNRAHAEVFQALYPKTWASCVEYARSHPEHLACEMQRLESTVMIETAAASFIDCFPDVPVLTIHDALIVPRAHATTAASFVTEAFDVHCDLKPVITTKVWSSVD